MSYVGLPQPPLSKRAPQCAPVVGAARIPVSLEDNRRLTWCQARGRRWTESFARSGIQGGRPPSRFALMQKATCLSRWDTAQVAPSQCHWSCSTRYPKASPLRGCPFWVGETKLRHLPSLIASRFSWRRIVRVNSATGAPDARNIGGRVHGQAFARIVACAGRVLNMISCQKRSAATCFTIATSWERRSNRSKTAK